MDAQYIRELVEAAQGKRKLTLLLRGAQVLNVYSGEVEWADVGIYRDRVVYVGKDAPSAEGVLDVEGVVVPGFIDTHLHIESSMVTPVRFAEAVLPHGTTTVCADPHEIANVLGIEGVRMMLENSRELPMRITYFVPTCVPESDAVTAGAEITPEDVERALDWEGIVGLGEVMDFESVLAGREKFMRILEIGWRRRCVIDGHCVLLSGARLNAYVATGPEADHENFTVESAVEKLRRGMYVKLRGPYILDPRRFVRSIGSLPSPWNRVILVTDDVMPDTLAERGHLDFVVRSMIEAGMDEVEAIRSVTLRPATHMRMFELGAVSPGKLADLVVLGSLKRIDVRMVLFGGKVVARDGRLVAELPERRFDKRALGTVRVKDLRPEDFEFRPPISDGKLVLNVIEFRRPDPSVEDVSRAFLEMIVTKRSTAEVEVRGGRALLGDVALMVVMERHRGTGKRGYGFVKGFMERGAIATTVAHDSHNLAVIGTDPRDMHLAATEVVKSEGGLVATLNGEVLSRIELPIAGLMSEEPVRVMAEKMRGFRRALERLGAIDHPYMPIVSLLTLSVIPEARVTDKGLFDVNAQRFVDPVAAVVPA
ncbi:MAG: amidohydrolase family protein [Thaumarchaeota archaeon]|nr:amidohydrolase family protein [Candidatus Calditenuaceae archaeon]MDW8042914.1 adenine deaminase C-terminal domain-containing protein [Nitrososphaerota archaeon]